MNQESSLSISCTPIAYVRSTMYAKFDAPHQATDTDAQEGMVELIDNEKLKAGLSDLEGFEYIWLIWWFHKNTTWRPKVLPPRGSSQRRGVFATRSPHRPNPIGISAVKLHRIEGKKLFIGPCDLIDGTPILDIKPYIPTADSFPESNVGWLLEVESALESPPLYTVEISTIASEQLSWLKEKWNIDFLQRAIHVLERDPTPHKTRRITRLKPDRFRMGCGAWRVIFSVKDTLVTIQEIMCGYPGSLLFDAGYEKIQDREAQVEFLDIWGKDSVI